MAVGLVDFRRAIRSLRRSPSFTLTALFVLALGIGANTAIFSVVYGILLRPLPYRDADRLVGIVAERDYDGRRQAIEANFSLADLEDWQAHSRAFESVALYASEAHALAGPGGAEVVHGAYVTASFFDTVGGRLALGRPLGLADDTSPSAVISHRLWLRRFGGSPSVLGQTITLTSQPYTIVGVADATFRLPSERTDIWAPAGFAQTLNPWMAMRGNRGFHPIARLKPAATIVEARAHADAVAQALSRDDPSAYGSMRAAPVLLRDRIVGPVRPMLLIMFACVALVLVVACANVANLLLARGTERARDVAVRLALGASRSRIATESLIETGLLAAAGTVLGIGIAVGLVRAIVQTAPANVPRLDAVQLDIPVLLFSAALAVLTTVTVGMVPAWRSAGTTHELKVGHGGLKGGRTGRRIRRVLVVTELAVSLTLLVAATVLGRSLLQLLETDLGVTTDRVVVANLHLAFGRSLTGAQQVALADRLVERVSLLPGVQSAGLGTALPPNRATYRIATRRRDPATGEEVDYLVDAVAATPTFFESLGVRLLRGRRFEPRDDARGRPVMIMSAGTARHVFGDGDVIGRTLPLPFYRDGQEGREDVTLVGIIGDVKYSGLDRAADGAIYRPYAQHPLAMTFLVARAAVGHASVTEALRHEIGRVDPQITTIGMRTLDEAVLEAAAEPRFRTWLLCLLAGLALALAGVGLYGVVAYSVSARTSEIGIRMALGATSGSVVTLIMREGMLLASAGVTLGVLGAFALTRALGTLLYGVTATDPLSFAVAGAVLTAVTAVASYVPARRASAVNPMIALKAE